MTQFFTARPHAGYALALLIVGAILTFSWWNRPQ